MSEARNPIISEILPNLFVGNADAVHVGFEGAVLSVLEHPPLRPDSLWIPVCPSGPPAIRAQLNAATDVIRDCRFVDRPLLVHCGAGMERSPLTIAWYLFRYGDRWPRLSAAYDFVKEQHSITVQHYDWLPWLSENER